MSRRVKLFFAASLDGFVAGPNGELDWLLEDQDYGYETFIADVDTLLIGRRTYDVIADFDYWPYGDRNIYVLSRRDNQPIDDRVTFVRRSVEELIGDLREQPGGDIWLVGGIQLLRAAVEHDLIDEVVVNIHPVILSDGVPVIPAVDKRIRLSLIDHQVYDVGLILLRYRVNRSKGVPLNLSGLIGLKWGRLMNRLPKATGD